ncbi:MAG: GspH/FimT family pseudopilin [Acidobacteria bacterium]|nr:GspH/FimT family pseudopilin [Acidobacteriota bacterium]MCI0722727.1 GspH/FimT family pseudopilin [Acidobacteriota bacterium]
MRTQDNKQKGFTLLEVVIVMGIIMAMTAAVIPSITTSMELYRLNASAQEIVSQLQSARLRAVRGNVMCAFLMSASGRQFGIDMDGDGNISSSTDVLLPLKTNISFVDLSTPPVASAVTLSNGTKTGIGFTPRGTLTAVASSGLPDYNPANLAAAGYAIYLTNTQDDFVAVSVSPMGRVRTWLAASPNGATWK